MNTFHLWEEEILIPYIMM